MLVFLRRILFLFFIIGYIVDKLSIWFWYGVSFVIIDCYFNDKRVKGFGGVFLLCMVMINNEFFIEIMKYIFLRLEVWCNIK